MPASPSRTTPDLRHQQDDILDYIHEIVQELADMAMRAGHEDLADSLRGDILRARDDCGSSRRERKSSAHG